MDTPALDVRSRWRSRVLLAAVLSPFAWLAVTCVRYERVLLVADLWETLLATIGAAHARQLVGPWSRVGVFHLGPAWFYWAAPFVAAWHDHPIGLMVAALTLAALCLAIACLTVSRAAGDTAGVVAVAVAVVAVHQLGMPGLATPWNPTVLILPTCAGLVVAADAWWRGSTRSIGLALLLGAFVAQSHLAAIPVGMLVAAVGLAGAIRHRLTGEHRLPLAHAVVLGACAVLPWVPVAIDQVHGRHNAVAVAEYGATGNIGGKPAPKPPGYFTDLSPHGAIHAMSSEAALSEPATASWAGFDLHAGINHQPSRRSDAMFALLVVAGLLGARPWQRRVGDLGSPTATLGTYLCRLGIVGLALEVVAAVGVRHDFRTYLVVSAAGVGMALWMGIALAAHAIVTARLPSAMAVRVPLASAVAATVVVAAVLPHLRAPFPTSPDPVLQTVTLDRLDEQIGHSVVVHDNLFRSTLPASMQLVWELHQRGHQVAMRGDMHAHFGDWFSGAPAVGPTLFLLPRGVGPPAGCQIVGPYLDQRLCIRPELH